MFRNSHDTSTQDRMRERQHPAADRMYDGAMDGSTRPVSGYVARASEVQVAEQKGGYTTSIVVDATAKLSPVVTVRQGQPQGAHQNYLHHQHQHHHQRHQQGTLTNKFPRSISEIHEPQTMYPAVLQKRYSNISEGKPHRHHNGGAVSKQHNGVSNGNLDHTTAPHHSMNTTTNGDHNASVRTSDSSYPRNTHGADDYAHTRTHEKGAHPAMLSTTDRASSSQPSFSVVPSPPPLSVFAGRRDVKDPSSVSEKQIVSAKGTVRGFKNRVRAGIATFWTQAQDTRNYRLLEQGKLVVYATSMSVVRETSERCKIVRSILQNHMVRYEERDLYMSRDLQQELQDRLEKEGIIEVRLPHVFADGIHLGSSEELEKLNEAGELRQILDNYQKIVVRIMCDKCGGYRFVPCDFCHGSKKSLLRNHFTEEFCALRCMHCDDNGLRRCDMCKDQQE